MLGLLKRMFSKPQTRHELSDVADWARERGHDFKRERDGQGFVVDGMQGARPWRMEWGPSQRAYIEGRELRLRMELSLPVDMQMLLLGKALMLQLERQTYEQFTESTQTQIGDGTPEEMRWLVMFPKVGLATLPSLKEHIGAVASAPEAGLAWIEGALAEALERALGGVLANDAPFVLMTLRNRAYLRLRLPVADVAAIGMALELFETAAVQLTRSASTHVDANAEWAGTASSAWQSLKPDDPADRKRR